MPTTSIIVSTSATAANNTCGEVVCDSFIYPILDWGEHPGQATILILAGKEDKLFLITTKFFSLKDAKVCGLVNGLRKNLFYSHVSLTKRCRCCCWAIYYPATPPSKLHDGNQGHPLFLPATWDRPATMEPGSKTVYTHHCLFSKHR